MQTTTVEVRGEQVRAVEIGRHGKLVPTRQVLAVIGPGAGHHVIDTIDDAKEAARQLIQIARRDDGPQLKHSEALEAIAKVMGYDNFPALRDTLPLQVQSNGVSHGR